MQQKASGLWAKLGAAKGGEDFKILHSSDEMMGTKKAWRDVIPKCVWPLRPDDQVPDPNKFITSNFGHTTHYFDLSIYEQWRLCFELLKIGDAESREASWVVLKEVRYSNNPKGGEEEYFNLPRFWMVEGHGPPHSGFLSFMYDLPLGKMKDPLKRRAKIALAHTNRRLFETSEQLRIPRGWGEKAMTSGKPKLG